MKVLKFIFIFIFVNFVNTFAFVSFDSSFQASTFTEGKDYYYLTITKANIKKTDFNAYVQNGILYIEVKKERQFSKNAISLPFDAEIKNIEAKYEDEILTFKIKKIKERREEKITIKIQ